nr:hypothetical protein GCM10020241_21600 [Streptoalloteichus tenebrarius]
MGNWPRTPNDMAHRPEDLLTRKIPVRLDDLDDFMKKFEKGSTYTDHGFMSTSLGDIERRGNVTLTIESRSAVDISVFSGFEWEMERLIGPGARFRVADVVWHGPFQPEITLREIEPPGLRHLAEAIRSGAGHRAGGGGLLDVLGG